MLRLSLLVVVVALVESPAYADGPISLDSPAATTERARPAPSQPPGAGVRFDAANVSVRMPILPARAEGSYRLLDGTLVRRWEALEEVAGFTYAATVHAAERPFGGSELEHLSSQVESFMDDSEDGEVVRSQSVWFQGLPGVDVELVDRRTDRVVHARILVGRSRVYWLALGAPRSASVTLASRRDGYFESLSPTPGDAPSTFGNGQVTDGRPRWLYPPEGRFAVELLADAARTDLRLALGGREYDGFRYSVVGGSPQARYDVIVLDFDGRSPADALTEFETYVIGANGNVRERRDVAREGHGARELTIESGSTLRTAAIVSTPRRLYALIHTSSMSDSGRLAASRERFFETFRILGDVP